MNNFEKAILYYTKGTQLNCEDKELIAKLFCNIRTAYFYLGETFVLDSVY